jgi:hypothetical protein
MRIGGIGGKARRKGTTRKKSRRWVDLKCILERWSVTDWINVAQGPVEGSLEDGDETSGSIKCWEELLSRCTTGSFSKAQLHEVGLFYGAYPVSKT